MLDRLLLLIKQHLFIYPPMFFLIPQGLEAFKLPLKKSLVNLALDSTNERHIYEIIAPSAKVNRRRSLANGRHEIFVAPQSVCP